jgi:hypothetical protein
MPLRPKDILDTAIEQGRKKARSAAGKAAAESGDEVRDAAKS